MFGVRVWLLLFCLFGVVSINHAKWDIASASYLAKYKVPVRATVECVSCLKFVNVLESKLPPNATETQLNNALNSICDDVPIPKQDCETLVKQEKSSSAARYIINHAPAELVCLLMNLCMSNCCLTETTPEQVHLALTEDPSQVVVMWSTLEKSKSVASYGVYSGKYQFTNNGTISTITEGGWKGYLHTVNLTQLQPGQRYYYRVGDPSAGWSEEFSFVNPDQNKTTHKIIFVADLGTDECSDYTVNRITEEVSNGADFVYHGGDIAYIEANQFVMDMYLRKVQSFAALAPYMVVVGNHEDFFHYSGFLARFTMPYSTSGTSNNFWYSFDYGPIHFLGYSTEHDLGALSEQRRFIEKDLEAANKRRSPGRPWIIMVGHKMMYCSTVGSDCDDQSPKFRKELEPVAQKYGVDIFMNGHMHSYERTYPVYKDSYSTSYENPNATVYLINGGGGAHSTDTYDCDLDFQWQPQPGWSAKRLAMLGFSRIEVNATHFNWKFISSTNGLVYDEVTIIKSKPTSWLV